MIKTIVNYVNREMSHPKTPLLTYYSKDIIQTALVYRFLYEHYVRDYISLETIIHRLDYSPIKSDSSIILNHLIFHRTFKSFRKHYKAGRGCVYLFDSPIKSEVLGYLTGIIYWMWMEWNGLKLI